MRLPTCGHHSDQASAEWKSFRRLCAFAGYRGRTGEQGVTKSDERTIQGTRDSIAEWGGHSTNRQDRVCAAACAPTVDISGAWGILESLERGGPKRRGFEV